MVKNFSFVFIGYGLYCLGFYVSRAVEVYKGVAISNPPIPISTTFIFILVAIVLFIEGIFFIADYLKDGE